MRLEQQVLRLELAKKLKELGVKQESIFVWQNQKDWHTKKLTNKWKVLSVNKYDNTSAGQELGYSRYVSAFTVAEIGEILPREANVNGMCDWWSQKNKDGSWSAQYRYNINTKQTADTEVDARAKMLIYLLENKVITL